MGHGFRGEAVEFAVCGGRLAGVGIVDGALLQEADPFEVSFNGVDAAVYFAAFIEDGVGISLRGLAVHGAHFHCVAASLGHGQLRNQDILDAVTDRMHPLQLRCLSDRIVVDRRNRRWVPSLAGRMDYLLVAHRGFRQQVVSHMGYRLVVHRDLPDRSLLPDSHIPSHRLY